MAATLGPVDVAVIEFEGGRFRNEVASVLADVIDPGIVRIVDLVFLAREEDGSVRAIELDEVAPEVADAMSPLTDEISGLLSDEDVSRVGERLGTNSLAAIIALEHAWLGRVSEAVTSASGRMVALERIPADVVEKALVAREMSR
ncbi:MAG TPA: DUF6325 family protein [Candidatus Dormibacteraeota bacterium]|jgi:hypothetical protein